MMWQERLMKASILCLLNTLKARGSCVIGKIICGSITQPGLTFLIHPLAMRHWDIQGETTFSGLQQQSLCTLRWNWVKTTCQARNKRCPQERWPIKDHLSHWDLGLEHLKQRFLEMTSILCLNWFTERSHMTSIIMYLLWRLNLTNVIRLFSWRN